MKKKNSKAVATANQQAIETRYLRIIQPDDNFNMKTSGVIYFNGKAIYVQDLCDTQNSQLFEKGIKMIDTLVTPKRREYLLKVFQILLPNEDLTNIEIMQQSQKLCPIIAFVCDIACHSNKKLAHPEAYDKDFKKYVANLFNITAFEDSFSRYKNLGGEYIPIPEWFVKPEKYYEYFNIA